MRQYAKTRLGKYQAIESAIQLIKMDTTDNTDDKQVYRRVCKTERTEAVFIDAKPTRKKGVLRRGIIVDFSDLHNVQVYKGDQTIQQRFEVTEQYKESHKGNGYKQYGSRWMKQELVLLPYLYYTSTETRKTVITWGHDPDYQINHLATGDLDTADTTHLEVVTSYENKLHRSYMSDLRSYVNISQSYRYGIKGLSVKRVKEVYNKVLPYICERSLDEYKLIKTLSEMGVLYKRVPAAQAQVQIAA